jgi:hypothetical protein
MGAVTASFWDGVLTLCKAPFTANLVEIFDDWQRWEGGGAENNPLNSERRMPGSRPYNSAGVQSYQSVASGASATAQDLLNGRYPAILAAMRANEPIDNWSVEPIPDEIDTWGTHGFATYLRQLTPTQGDTMTPQQAQMLLDIWHAVVPSSSTILATAGARPEGETEDIHGQGAVYTVSGLFKQYVPAAALAEYVARYGAVHDWSGAPYALDRLIEVTASGYPLLPTTEQTPPAPVPA